MSIQSEIERIRHEKYSIIQGEGTFTIPNGVTTIRRNAFYMANFEQPLFLPDSVEEINYEAFYDCGGVLNIPKYIKRLNARAFRGAQLGRFSEITELPDGLEKIGELCFLNQSHDGFKITEIPASVKIIEQRAFEGCGLTEITFKGKPDSIGNGIFNTNPDLTIIRVPWSEDDPDFSSLIWGAQNATIVYDYTGE